MQFESIAELDAMVEESEAEKATEEQKDKRERRAAGTGQIIEKGERKYLVRIFTGRNAQTGKREYVNKTIKGTRTDAERYLRKKLHELDTGTFVKPTKMTMNEYLDKWLETAAKPRVRERTYVDYQYVVNRYVRPGLGTLKLVDLRPLDIQGHYSNLQAQGLSARIVHYAHAMIASSLKQAVKWGMLSRNPASLVELPRQQRKEMRALSPEEAANFLDAAAEYSWGIILAFALTTGMRPEEYLGLQWRYVDLEHGKVTIERTVVWRAVGGGWYFSEPKTSSSRRTLPLPPSMTVALRQHKREQAEQRLKAGPKYQNNDLVFATGEGTPIMRANLTNRHFKPTLKRARLPQSIRLYDLRHTCATLLLAAGENPKIVSERLGHKSVAITLDTYSHVLPSMQQAAAEKLERMLFGKTGTL